MKSTQRYIVWVDSVPNYFNSIDDAIKEKQFWVNMGYENVITEKE